MDIFTVAFFGHRYIDSFPDAEAGVEEIVRRLLDRKQYVEFLVGREGDFDQIVSSTIKRMKRTFRDDNSSLTWVLPYPTADFVNNEEEYGDYYDNIEVCEESSKTHFKGAIQARNKSMVDRADLIVCYIDHKSGGAYQTLKYAMKQEKEIINIADDIEE